MTGLETEKLQSKECQKSRPEADFCWELNINVLKTEDNYSTCKSYLILVLKVLPMLLQCE